MKRLMKLSIVGEIENILMKVMMAWSWIGLVRAPTVAMDCALTLQMFFAKVIQILQLNVPE
jgi:hypothetical protein